MSTHSDPQTGPDSDGLGFWYAGGFAVGSVPEVNGPEAREVPAFAPTKHEIVQIAKYWLDRLLENRITFFLTGATGGSEARVNIYAKRRAYRVSEFLSEQEFDDLIADAERRLKNKYEINDTDWNIYKSGSQEDRDQFQEKLLRKLETDELLETDSKKEK